MARTRDERSRLLFRTARIIGVVMTATALLCVCLPSAVPSPWPLLFIVITLVALGVCHVLLPRVGTRNSAIAIVVLGVIALVGIALIGTRNAGSLSALPAIAGGSIAAVSIAVGVTKRTLPALLGAAAASVAAVCVGLVRLDAHPLRILALVLSGWVFCGILAVWLGTIVPETMRRITSMSRAFYAERLASETEARRRQDARLLHDTVLATLTLLAHSGVGVGEQALREQAAGDAALLRQLRLGLSPEPAASGDYMLTSGGEPALGNTLESVKQRFRRIGLEVAWHGSGHVLLPSETLDAFLMALAECLENVRRHSGVDEAHVTITDDDLTVRAMVTDAGVGFDLGDIAPGRLGFAESIVARLRDVGGNARLFSSPGSGTTVVLEVPK